MPEDIEGFEIGEEFLPKPQMKTISVRDLGDKPEDAVIDAVQEVNTKFGKRVLLTIRRRGKEEQEKVFLNKTSVKAIVEKYDKNVKNWINKGIKLQKVQALVRGATKEVILVSPL
jgi:hypothetical protein